MEDVLVRFVTNLIGRLHGPMTFRFLFQPGMAAFLAIRAGLHDARDGRPAYGWALFGAATERRRQLLREGWKAVASVFVVATLVDVVYQLIMFGWVYPGEAVAVAAMLAFVPYVALRGPVNRLAAGPRRRNPS